MTDAMNRRAFFVTAALIFSAGQSHRPSAQAAPCPPFHGAATSNPARRYKAYKKLAPLVPMTEGARYQPQALLPDDDVNTFMLSAADSWRGSITEAQHD